MPHIIQKRADIKAGSLYISDLWPNTSLRNQIYDPKGQTKYLRYFGNQDLKVIGAGPINTNKSLKGIQAYLADNIEVGGVGGGGGDSLTPVEAKAAADGILAVIAAGTAMSLAVVNALLPAASELAATTSASTGSLKTLLEILAGSEYLLPIGAELENGANQFTGSKGAITPGKSRITVQSGAFELSRLEGKLSKLKDASFTHLGVAGAAVVLYSDDGSVL